MGDRCVRERRQKGDERESGQGQGRGERGEGMGGW